MKKLPFFILIACFLFLGYLRVNAGSFTIKGGSLMVGDYIPPVYSSVSLVATSTCSNILSNNGCSITSTGSGNLLVIGVQVNVSADTITSVQDSKGDVATEVPHTLTSVSGSGITDLWYVTSTTSGATSVTVSTSGGDNYYATVWEVSGIASNPLAYSSSTPSRSVANTSSTSATINAGFIVATDFPQTGVSGIFSGNAFTNDTLTNASGWAHLIVTTATTTFAQWSNSAQSNATNIAAFNANILVASSSYPESLIIR